MYPSIIENLSGNLGERHRYLNSLVIDAFRQNTCYPSIEYDRDHPGEPAIDRLFKIDLASKQKNVNYIIQTLKNEDMLYVSRALNSLWLLEPEYLDIINPLFLENELYPQMRLQAVNKMRHWIHLYLRDPHRCKEFYQFYKENDSDVALKFLWHCSNDFILKEILDILMKITPKDLKVLSEKVPQVTKIYFDKLREDQTLLKYYLANDRKIFSNVKYLLKSDSDVFFYVIENFFDKNKFPLFKPEITKFIMKHHKTKFMEKPELYSSWFLNIDALAKYLSSDEIKELVLKLARAEYLGSWYSYKTVEPLVKRLCEEERSAFKKLVFVNKTIGPTVKNWQYPIPVPPVLTVPRGNLFEDRQLSAYDYGELKLRPVGRRPCSSKPDLHGQNNTLLNMLFDQYRFCNYKETLLQLRKRLKTESSAQNRQHILLVLVSKTGGRAEYLMSLLNLMAHYKNEPSQIRATIMRSLVKRAFVWRLVPEQWAILQEWGHGLGLDGSTPEATCIEGLHAVVIRDLLADVSPSDMVWEAFLDNFSTLVEYSLSASERSYIRDRLPTLLLTSAKSDANNAVSRLHLLLDTLAAYRLRFDACLGAIESISAALKSGFLHGESLLKRLYQADIGRIFFIKQNTKMLKTDDAYVNVLRHDISILKKTVRFDKLILKQGFKYEKFTRKLSIYFTERDGLAERYRTVLKPRVFNNKLKKNIANIARPLALLAGSSFTSLLSEFDAASPRTPQHQLAAALRSNAHIVRPAFEWESFGQRAAGAKLIANQITTCRQMDVERHLTEIFSWSRPSPLILTLAKRVNKEQEAYDFLAFKRPGAAFKAAVKHFRREKDNIDLRIWDTMKSHSAKIQKLNLKYFSTAYIESIPTTIRGEYYVLVYKACKTNLSGLNESFLSFIDEVDDQFILEEIDDFMRDCFIDIYCGRRSTLTYITIISKFLMLSPCEEILEERFLKVGIPFLNRFEEKLKNLYGKDELTAEWLLDSFLFYLRFNKVFFDVKYDSCLSLFKKITEWMQGFLPLEMWFDKYVAINLSVIYFKTVRHCRKASPELFSDECKKIKNVPQMLGTIFGKFITKEIEEWTQRCFPSITELYGRELVNYFNKYFYCKQPWDDSVQHFTVAFLNELLSNKCVLAKHIYMECRNQLESTKCENEIIKKILYSELDEIRFMAGSV